MTGLFLCVLVSSYYQRTFNRRETGKGENFRTNNLLLLAFLSYFMDRSRSRVSIDLLLSLWSIRKKMVLRQNFHVNKKYHGLAAPFRPWIKRTAKFRVGCHGWVGLVKSCWIFTWKHVLDVPAGETVQNAIKKHDQNRGAKVHGVIRYRRLPDLRKLETFALLLVPGHVKGRVAECSRSRQTLKQAGKRMAY